MYKCILITNFNETLWFYSVSVNFFFYFFFLQLDSPWWINMLFTTYEWLVKEYANLACCPGEDFKLIMWAEPRVFPKKANEFGTAAGNLLTNPQKMCATKLAKWCLRGGPWSLDQEGSFSIRWETAAHGIGLASPARSRTGSERFQPPKWKGSHSIRREPAARSIRWVSLTSRTGVQAIPTAGLEEPMQHPTGSVLLVKKT